MNGVPVIIYIYIYICFYKQGATSLIGKFYIMAWLFPVF